MTLNTNHMWKCVLKIFHICITGKNKFYFGGILILMPVLVVVELREIRVSFDLTAIFKDSKGHTIKEYLIESSKVFIVKFAIHTFFDIAIAKIFFFSLKYSLVSFLKLKWVDFHSYTIAELLNNQYEKADAAAIVIYYSFISVITNFVAVILTIYEIKSKTTGYFGIWMVFAGLVHLLIFIISNRVLHSVQKDYLVVKNSARALIENESSNFNIIKTYNLEESSEKRVRAATNRRYDMRLKYSILKSKQGLFYKAVEISCCIPLLILYYLDVVTDESLDATVSCIFHMCESLRTLLQSATKVSEQFNIFCIHETNIDSELREIASLETISTVECTNLSIPGLFSNIRFALGNSEKMAVVGANGSGKTTLLRALTGLIEYEGSIKIDGQELSCVNRKSLYTYLTWVSQSETYTYGTVINNLKYGNNATDEEVVEKCKEFGVHEVFSDLEDGYMKISGSLGTELSGGQRQRIAFMRGIIRNTPLLIVDDCLSGVNTNDRKILLSGLFREKDRMVIVVCRTYELLDKFDKILLLEGDRTKVGTFKELSEDLRVFFKTDIDSKHRIK